MKTPHEIVQDYLKTLNKFNVFTTAEISSMTNIALDRLVDIEKSVPVTLEVINQCFVTLPGLFNPSPGVQEAQWKQYSEQKIKFETEQNRVKNLFTFIQKETV